MTHRHDSILIIDFVGLIGTSGELSVSNNGTATVRESEGSRTSFQSRATTLHVYSHNDIDSMATYVFFALLPRIIIYTLGAALFFPFSDRMSSSAGSEMSGRYYENFVVETRLESRFPNISSRLLRIALRQAPLLDSKFSVPSKQRAQLVENRAIGQGSSP